MPAVLETKSCSSETEAKERKTDSEVNDVLSSCKHCIVVNGICFKCEKQMEADYGRTFEYLAKGCRLSSDAVRVIRQFNSEICFRQRKLHLVLDLDHTLLHSCSVAGLTNQEKYLIEQAGSREDLKKVPFSDYSQCLVKIRPFVAEFLRKASELFELHVYTMGTSEYAEAVVRFLDPQDIYFRQRVITRADGGPFKTLDLVLAEERGVVVVDDTPEMWPGHQKNLITIRKYNYFQDNTRANMSLKSFSEKKTDETEADGPLQVIFKFLEKVHAEFFKDETDSRDVRHLI